MCVNDIVFEYANIVLCKNCERLVVCYIQRKVIIGRAFQLTVMMHLTFHFAAFI